MNCSNCMSCHRLLSYLSLTAWHSSSSTLVLSLASFRSLSLALLFSLFFCCLVNSALVVDFLNRSCRSCPSSPRPVTAAVDDPLSAEQLHAHDRYQNVTEHKTSGHSIWNKMYRYAQLQHRRWVRPYDQHACHAQSVQLLHAHRSSTPCALQDVSTLRLHSRRHAHRCGYWRGRSMWRVTSTVSGL